VEEYLAYVHVCETTAASPVPGWYLKEFFIALKKIGYKELLPSSLRPCFEEINRLLLSGESSQKRAKNWPSALSQLKKD